MSISQSVEDLRVYLDALPSEKYKLNYLQRRVGTGEYVDPQKRKNLKQWEATADRVAASRPSAVRANFGPAKRDIFCRPADVRYVFVDLDDTESDSMRKVMLMKPALVVETSEDHYQVWLKTVATTPEENKNIWQQANDALGGDPGAAGHTQLGRLPGFPNRKKGRDNFTARVFYSLRYQLGQVSTLRPQRTSTKRMSSGSSQGSQKKQRRASSGRDGSQVDFGAVKDHIKASGYTVTDREITENLRRYSTHHDRQPGDRMTTAFADYAARTIRAARNSLGIRAQ